LTELWNSQHLVPLKWYDTLEDHPADVKIVDRSDEYTYVDSTGQLVVGAYTRPLSNSTWALFVAD